MGYNSANETGEVSRIQINNFIDDMRRRNDVLAVHTVANQSVYVICEFPDGVTEQAIDHSITEIREDGNYIGMKQTGAYPDTKTRWTIEFGYEEKSTQIPHADGGQIECPHCGMYTVKETDGEAFCVACNTEIGPDTVTDGGQDMPDEEIEHFDDIESLDDANRAVIDQDMVIRIQPPAPKATRYYYVENGEGKQKTAGHDRSITVPVDTARSIVRRNIPNNDLSGGGGVKAIDRTEMF